MSPSIEIDDQVLDALKANAEPFVDSPNSVLRRLLGIERPQARGASGKSRGATGRSSTATPKRSRPASTRARVASTRAPAGSLMPESEYELPILQVLAERDGRAASREVVEEVGRRVAPKLRPKDLETLDSGDVRWENRVHFTRLRLIDRGLLKKGSPRGVWELSDEGAIRVREG